MPKEEVSELVTECIYNDVIFLCGSEDYGTFNMLGYIRKCPKYPYGLNNDPKQRILNFERKSSGKQLIDSMSHAFDLKEC